MADGITITINEKKYVLVADGLDFVAQTTGKVIERVMLETPDGTEYLGLICETKKLAHLVKTRRKDS